MVGKSSYNDKYLNKLHQDILKIMDEVDRICKENNLRYYLMCGVPFVIKGLSRGMMIWI